VADQTTCLKNAQLIDPKARLCQTWVCEQDTTRADVTKFCHCQPPYPPQNPCPYGANSPVVVFDGPSSTCFCCCSCFAYGTKIAQTPDSNKEIQLFTVGEPVLAAGPGLDWHEATVEFSSGVEPHPDYGKTVLVVYYSGPEGERSIVVTPDHVFAVKAAAGVGIKRAYKLVPGADELVAADGSAVRILGTETAGWNKGLHHIATTNTPATSLDGHLLISDGLVSADWAVQISDLDVGEFAAHNQGSELPTLGTAEYEAAHSGVAQGRFAAVAPGAAIEHLRPEGVRPYGSEAFDIPADAMTFFSQAQAEELRQNSTQRPVTVTAGREAAFYLFKLVGAFYPDVYFHLQWDDLLPNAYSFVRYGLNVVVLSGGLVRTEGVTFDGLAVVLAHEVGHLIGGPPLDRQHRYTCQGQADFAGVGAVLRGAYWMGDYPTKTSAGLAEVERLFSLITSPPPPPLDYCNSISLDCRMQAMRAGLRLGPLPECAGGPKVPFLAPVGVRTEVAPDGVEVRVAFNLAVAGDSIDASKFGFEPEAEIVSVRPDPLFPEVIVVTADLAVGGGYKLSMEDLLTPQGKELDGGRAVVPVKIVPAGE
jgi:hypothetical protein